MLNAYTSAGTFTAASATCLANLKLADPKLKVVGSLAFVKPVHLAAASSLLLTADMPKLTSAPTPRMMTTVLEKTGLQDVASSQGIGQRIAGFCGQCFQRVYKHVDCYIYSKQWVCSSCTAPFLLQSVPYRFKRKLAEIATAENENVAAAQ